jgi:hypothetical protein
MIQTVFNLLSLRRKILAYTVIHPWCNVFMNDYVIIMSYLFNIFNQLFGFYERCYELHANWIHTNSQQSVLTTWRERYCVIGISRCAPAAATVQVLWVNLLLTPTCHESWCPWQVINAIVLEDVGFIGRHLYNYSYRHHNHWSCCSSCLASLVVLVLLCWSPAC